jgi:hypothetical protein
MSDVIVGPKGELEIPKEIIEALKVRPGDLVRFSLLNTGAVLIRAKNLTMDDLQGMLYREEQVSVPVERMSPWD